MKNLKSSTLIIIFVCVYIVLGIYMFVQLSNPIYKPAEDKNAVQVYMDLATFPAIFQICDYLKQPEESVKFVSWRRFDGISERLKKYKNTTVLNINEKAKEIDVSPILTYNASHPNAKYIIHVNWAHASSMLLKILNGIPYENIKEIHIYEDSLNHIVWDKFAHSDFYFIHRDKSLSDYNLIFHFNNAKKFHTLEWFFYPEMWHIKGKIKNNPVSPISFDALKNVFQKDKKFQKDFYELIGFDYDYYKNYLKHPYLIYFFGVPEPKKLLEQQISFLDDIKNGEKNKLLPQNINYYYKEHPSFSTRKKGLCFSNTAISKEKFSDVLPIESFLPIEILYVSDLIPDYIAGYSSSLFLSTPKSVKIIAYQERENDVYLPLLLKSKKLKLNQVYRFEDEVSENN